MRSRAFPALLLITALIAASSSLIAQDAEKPEVVTPAEAPAETPEAESPATETPTETTETETPTAKAAATPTVTANIVAVFELHGELSEASSSDDPFLSGISGETLYSMQKRIRQAGNDEKVAGLVLILNSLQASSAQIEELRQAIHEVREKKPVFAHADSLSTRSFNLLSAAKRVSVSPTGDVWINGLSMQGMYVRGLLDMIGVQPDFLTCGSYKSAAEMFILTESSPESLEMNNWLLDSLYGSLLNNIAKSRGVESEQVSRWIDQGLYSAESAQKAGIIDAVESREELLAHVKSVLGSKIRLEKSYGKKKSSDLDLESPLAAMQLWAKLLSGSKPTRSTKNAIAVVYLDGPIMLGKPETSLFGSTSGIYSETVRKTLNKIADDPRIKGVVLRINSPGGSATASEIMLKSIRHLQEVKPVVVSMGGTAASGGYYISARAERIYADASTLTGSIGVVAGKLSTLKMWSRIGVTFDENKRGAKAGLMTSNIPWTEEEKADIQGWMDEVYNTFKSHVVEGRQGKLTKDIEEIAGGRVYTGQQALEIGLVDEIGSLQNAIDYAASQVSLSDYEIRQFPEAQSFLEQLLADVSESRKPDDKNLSAGLWTAVGPALKQLDPTRTRMLQQAFLNLEQIQEERLILAAPILNIVDDFSSKP